METHHGASNHFGHADWYAAQAQGKTPVEIADWIRANPGSHELGLSSKVYRDVSAAEQTYLAQQQAQKAKQGDKQYGSNGSAGGTQGAKKVDIPTINKPNSGGGTISPHDFASDYMNKIMNSRKNGQDPLRYDKEAQQQQQPVQTPDTGADNKENDSPYDANRYKDTQFNYDDQATKYKSPQYTG